MTLNEQMDISNRIVQQLVVEPNCSSIDKKLPAVTYVSIGTV